MQHSIFPRDELAAYLRAVERHPELGRAEELALAHRARAGDVSAANGLACSSLRHVVGLARAMRGYGLSLSDLVAEGNLGLLEAVPRFDPDHGVRFWTFARFAVRSRMLAFVRCHWSVVSMAGGSINCRLFFSAPRERARLRALFGEGYDTTGALAERFGTSRAKVEALEARTELRDQSLSAPSRVDGAPLVEWLASAQPDAESTLAEAQDRQHLSCSVEGALSDLDDRERFIAKRRLLDEDRPTLSELGAQLGVSRERVRQLEARACGKLRQSLREQLAPAAA
jgi:RNA polymerase sigma-32 factor